jgi:hypothetical protein
MADRHDPADVAMQRVNEARKELALVLVDPDADLVTQMDRAYVFAEAVDMHIQIGEQP